MGNWRTVNMIGSVSPEEVKALRAKVVFSYRNAMFGTFGPLSYDPESPSICGLDEWPYPQISAYGNLAERDYAVSDVAAALRDLIAVAPSLELKVHCGGDWESPVCVATITVAGGEVTVGGPEVKEVVPISTSEAVSRLLHALGSKT
jgi:hypothetical protein